MSHYSSIRLNMTFARVCSLHYEKFSDGTVKCIEDEIPFEIPNGWAWARLGSLLNLFITGPFGSSLHKSDYVSSGTPLINPMNIVNGRIQANPQMLVSQDTVSRLSVFKVLEGDIVIARRGEMGRCAVVESSQNGWLCGTGSFDLRVSRLIDSNYIAARIRASDSVTFLSGNSLGNTMLNLNQSILNSLLIPVPPFNEQRRVLCAISEADGLLSTLAESNTKLRTFIVDAKAKILDLAIRGKLVPQDPADEPASILLERIRADKEEQIKAGKIKRDKKESFIFRGEDNSYYEKIGDDVRCIDDQLPYVIPENWAWARLSSISIINPKQALDENLLVSFVPMPLIEDGFRSNNTSEVRKWKEVRTGYTHFADGDIGVAKITPCFENRKSLVFHGLANGYGAGTTELFIIRCNNQLIVPEYLLWLMKTKAFIDGGIQTFSSAVGQQRVSKEYIERTFIPLPPVRAQKNICSKTVSLLGVIETLEQSLK